MTRTDFLRALVGWLPAPALAADAGASSSTAERQFNVRLDGATFGSHRFVLDRAGQCSTLRSEACFDVSRLGLSLSGTPASVGSGWTPSWTVAAGWATR
jgi:hypothetical protein